MPNVTFYPGKAPSGVIASYRETERALERGRDVETSQMCFLGSELLRSYDHVVISELGHVVRIDNGYDGTWSCEATDKELRYAHDLYRLWRAGEFDGGRGEWLSVAHVNADGTPQPTERPMTMGEFHDATHFHEVFDVALSRTHEREFELTFVARARTRVATSLCRDDGALDGVRGDLELRLYDHLRREFR